jgi:sodium-coupled neutral amino acid transporter 2
MTPPDSSELSEPLIDSARWAYDDGDDSASANSTIDQDGTASVATSVVNMCNNIVGAGIFSMPWCMSKCTIVTGFALMTAMCIVNGISFVMLAYCCELSGTFNYKKMGEMALGGSPRFGKLVQVCVLMYTTGSCISFVILTADFLVGEGTGVFAFWAPDSLLSNRTFTLCMISCFVYAPLCSLRNLAALKYSSTVSVVGTCYAAFMLIYAAMLSNETLVEQGAMTPADLLAGNPRDSVVWLGFPIDVFVAIPVFNVAFTAHYNAPRYYRELKGRSVPKFKKVVFTAMGFCGSAYALCGFCGYLVFGDATVGDVLKNFQDSYPLALVGRLILAFVVIMTFPLANHSLRDRLVYLHCASRAPADAGERCG